MFTDPIPRKHRAEFSESDRVSTLDLPQSGVLTEIAQCLESAMQSEKIRDVRSTCIEFLATASDFYEVRTCGIRVLAARPLRTREHGTFELFGDYTPESMLIRVWMRTAVRKEVTSFGTFLSTLVTSSAIISISRSSGLWIRGTRGASTNEQALSITMRRARR